MLTKIKKALATCPQDGMIYLIIKLSDASGFFMAHSHLIYMVIHCEATKHQSLATEYLRLNTDVEVSAIECNQQFPSGRYNMLEALPVDDSYDDETLNSFMNLCLAHTEHMSGLSFLDFFHSLVNLFQYPREQDYKNLIGLFGELSFIKHVYDKAGVDLSEKWHVSGCSSKYDIVTDWGNLEIKSTRAADELVTIKHDQLFNSDRNFLVTVMMEECAGGITLNQLIKKMHDQRGCFNGYLFTLNLEKERRRVSPVDAEVKKFNVYETRIYEAKAINPFEKIPANIANLTYQLDLIDQPDVALEDWFKKCRNI